MPPVVGGCGRGGDRLPAGFWRLVGSRLQQQWPSTHMVVGCGMRDGDPLLALRSVTKHTTRDVLPFSGACSSFHTATASKVLDGVLIGTGVLAQCHFRVSITSVSYGVYKSVCSMSAW